jgi:hypothetical protein
MSGPPLAKEDRHRGRVAENSRGSSSTSPEYEQFCSFNDCAL